VPDVRFSTTATRGAGQRYNALTVTLVVGSARRGRRILLYKQLTAKKRGEQRISARRGAGGVVEHHPSLDESSLGAAAAVRF